MAMGIGERIGVRLFRNRSEAGRILAQRLEARAFEEPLVLALPRGGVPVGYEVAKRLKAPLDLVLVRKIGHPEQPELALGAVVDGAEPQIVRNEDVLATIPDGERVLQEGAARELKEIDRRRKLYLGNRPRALIAGKVAIVVDDGIATGATMRAALIATRRQSPDKLVLAVPVAPADILADLGREVDEVVCLATPHPFFAISLHYGEFPQVSDREVIRLLKAAPKAD